MSLAIHVATNGPYATGEPSVAWAAMRHAPSASWSAESLRAASSNTGDPGSLAASAAANWMRASLTSLVPEKGGESRRIDACNRCHGYLKALAQLGPIRPELLPLEDLASVELDLAAIERGYQRPQNAPGARGVAITER